MKTITIRQTSKDLQWANTCLLAEAEQEKFEDVEVITTKAFYADKLAEFALSRLWTRGIQPTSLAMRMAIARIHLDNDIEVYEHVYMAGNTRLVVVYADRIDDDAIYKAFELLAKTIDEGCTYKRFGKRITHSLEDISWMLTD